MTQPLRASRGGAACALAVLLLWSPVAARAQAPDPQDPQQPSYPSLRFIGFGDINYSVKDQPEGPRGFVEGQLVLHMVSALSPRTAFFGEISFTPRSDAGTGSPTASGFNAEVERMIIRFDHSDPLKVSFGRYHTPINYWNTAFHHGQWLQTTISRPEMIRFGGELLPVHFVGGLFEGSTPGGGWNLNYKIGVGNGRDRAISRAGDAGDVNDDRAWLAGLFARPDHAFGLEVGGAAYGDTITLADGREFGERIVSAYAAWQREDPELIAEFAAVRHDEAGSGLITWSRAYYLQAAYRLQQAGGAFKPYVRFEHIGVDDADVPLAGVQELDQTTVGLRYDLSSFAAAKAEYRTWTRGEGSLRNHGGFFQIAFTF